MKKFVFAILAIFAVYCFVVNQDFRDATIEEFNNVTEKIKTEVGGGDHNNSEVSNDPVKHNSETKEFDFDIASEGYSTSTKNYFKEICYGSEFGSENASVVRWEKNMKIFVSGQKPDYLINELNSIVSELNSIIDPIQITFVNNKSDANYVIYFCSASQYGNAEPAAAPYVEDNYGLFIVNRTDEIKSGSMYVDIYRCNTIDVQKHILREELTQSLGLMKDSYSHVNSIFYQGWTETTSYAPIDVELIEILYN